MTKNGGKNPWSITREKILFFAGLALIAYEAVSVTSFDRPFHLEFVLGGLALAGVGITQWGDKH